MIPSVLQKNLFAKNFPGNLDWCFGNLAVNFLQKCETFPLKVQRLQKIIVFSKTKSSKPSSGLTEWNFDSPGRRFFSRKPKKIWSKYWEGWKTKTFPKKILNLFPRTRELRFRKPYSNLFVKRHKKFSRKWPKMFAQGTKIARKSSIFKRFFLKNVTWTRKMKFWKTHRKYVWQQFEKFLAQSTTVFPSRHERY